MKLTVNQLRKIIKEEVRKSLSEVVGSDEPAFIPSRLGRTTAMGPGGGPRLTADKNCVKWPNGVLHPDEIVSINYKGTSLPVVDHEKFEVPGSSWMQGSKSVTTPDVTTHHLYFTTPTGETIEYIDHDEH